MDEIETKKVRVPWGTLPEHSIKLATKGRGDNQYTAWVPSEEKKWTREQNNGESYASYRDSSLLIEMDEADIYASASTALNELEVARATWERARDRVVSLRMFVAGLRLEPESVTVEEYEEE